MSERWLLVGLGNPGPQYENTRHNIGFMVIHAIAEALGLQGKRESRFNAMVASGHWDGVPVVLAQPLTFMNLSGDAIGKILHYYKIPPEQMLVIYDDIALPFGRVRVRPDGSAGGHNGMKSIIGVLGGNQNFPRLRVGIGAPQGRTLHDHVLSVFSADERSVLDDIVKACVTVCHECVLNSLEQTMNRYNGMALIPEATPPKIDL